MNMASTSKAPAATSINLKIKGQDGHVVSYRIKLDAELHKLTDAYCKHKKLDPEAIQFFFDGNRVTGKQTPRQLGMEDEDEILAALHVYGGGHRAITPEWHQPPFITRAKVNTYGNFVLQK